MRGFVSKPSSPQGEVQLEIDPEKARQASLAEAVAKAMGGLMTAASYALTGANSSVKIGWTPSYPQGATATLR